MQDTSGTDDPKTPPPEAGDHPAGASGTRRESVLDPGSGSPAGPAANIREQQGNSAGGMVPARPTGPGGSDDGETGRSDGAGTLTGPDAPNPDAWDGEG